MKTYLWIIHQTKNNIKLIYILKPRKREKTMSRDMKSRLQQAMKKGDQGAEFAGRVRSQLRQNRGDVEETTKPALTDAHKKTNVYKIFNDDQISEKEKRNQILEYLVVKFESASTAEQKAEIDAINAIFTELGNEIFNNIDQYLAMNEENPLRFLNQQSDETFDKYMALTETKEELDQPLNALAEVMDDIVALYQRDMAAEAKGRKAELSEDGEEVVGENADGDNEVDLSIYVEDIENQVTAPRTGADISPQQALLYCLKKATQVRKERTEITTQLSEVNPEIQTLENRIKNAREIIKNNEAASNREPGFMGSGRSEIESAKAAIKTARKTISDNQPELDSKKRVQKRLKDRLDIIMQNYDAHQKVLKVLDITNDEFEKKFEQFIKLTRETNNETKETLEGIQAQMADSLEQTEATLRMASSIYKDLSILSSAVGMGLKKSEAFRDEFRTSKLGEDLEAMEESEEEEAVIDDADFSIDLSDEDSFADEAFDTTAELDTLEDDFNEILFAEIFRANNELVGDLGLLHQGLIQSGRNIAKTRTAVTQFQKSFKTTLANAKLDANQLAADVAFSAGVGINRITQLAGIAKQAVARGTMDDMNERALSDFADMTAQMLSYMESRVKIAEDSIRTTKQVNDIAKAGEQVAAEIEAEMVEINKDIVEVTKELDESHSGLSGVRKRQLRRSRGTPSA